MLADLPPPLLARLTAAAEVTVRPLGVASDETVAQAVGDCDGILSLLVQRVGPAVLAAAPNLAIVANCAIGVDNIDRQAARARGVVVTNTPDVLTADTADFTWALLLAVARRIVAADAFVRSGRFRGWDLGLFLGRSLAAMTFGVVGAGRIGQAVLARARGFGFRALLYHDRRPLPADREAALGARFRPLDALLAEADAVSLHLPLTSETHHLIDRRRLEAMRPGAILVNTSRGPVVDEAALAEALARGPLGGAGLDVFEREPEVHPALAALDNVVLAPHLGSATAETRFRMAECCIESLLECLVERRRPRLALE